MKWRYEVSVTNRNRVFGKAILEWDGHRVKMKGCFSRWRAAVLHDAKSMASLLRDPRFSALADALHLDAASVVQGLGKADGMVVDDLFAKVRVLLDCAHTTTLLCCFSHTRALSLSLCVCVSVCVCVCVVCVSA